MLYKAAGLIVPIDSSIKHWPIEKIVRLVDLQPLLTLNRISPLIKKRHGLVSPSLPGFPLPPLAEALEQFGGPLDVGEEEGDRPARQAWHMRPCEC